MDRTQINGGFFCASGLGRAVEAAADRILARGPLADGPASPSFAYGRSADGAAASGYRRPQTAG